MKPKNNYLEQLQRSREAAKTPDRQDLEKPVAEMTDEEVSAKRRELEMELIAAKSAELNERYKARVLGETPEDPGGYPQGKPQLFPLQTSARHWR